MDVSHSESRRNKLFEFIIQTHVETGAPVGSEAVCKRFHLRLSPATVRHVMGELERHELLTHPHTSAGRVPTDQGYRYYVDLLMTSQALTESETRAIDVLNRELTDDPLELLQAASGVLAELTGHAGAVLAPGVPHSALRRIDLIPVDAHRVVGLLMTTDGLLRHTLLEFAEIVDTAELARINRFLNEELSGQVLGTVQDRLQQALMDATNAFNYLYRRAQELWTLGGFMDVEQTVFVEGVSRLLSQPEFRDAQKSRRLVETLEARQPFATLLGETTAGGRCRIVIGAENPYPELGRCSVVSAPYRAGSRMAGSVGIVGPTRMDYGRASAIVEHVAGAVSRAMERFVA